MKRSLHTHTFCNACQIDRIRLLFWSLHSQPFKCRRNYASNSNCENELSAAIIDHFMIWLVVTWHFMSKPLLCCTKFALHISLSLNTILGAVWHMLLTSEFIWQCAKPIWLNFWLSNKSVSQFCMATANGNDWPWVWAQVIKLLCSIFNLQQCVFAASAATWIWTLMHKICFCTIEYGGNIDSNIWHSICHLSPVLEIISTSNFSERFLLMQYRNLAALLFGSIPFCVKFQCQIHKEYVRCMLQKHITGPIYNVNATDEKLLIFVCVCFLSFWAVCIPKNHFITSKTHTRAYIECKCSAIKANTIKTIPFSVKKGCVIVTVEQRQMCN